MHGLLPAVELPGEDLHLLPVHGPPLTLVVGHQREVHSNSWGQQGKEESLNTEKKCSTLVTPDDVAFQATVEKNLATTNTFKDNSDYLENTSNQKN